LVLAGYKHLKGDFLGLPMLDWIVFQKLMASEAACFSLADHPKFSSLVTCSLDLAMKMFKALAQARC
jgi:hypothetical protein